MARPVRTTQGGPKGGDRHDRQGRIIALVIAGTGLAWMAATAAGVMLDWPQRTRAFFDLAALAGFGTAIWMIYGLWRARQSDRSKQE